jgi:ABC-2 type transport system permease protein
MSDVLPVARAEWTKLRTVPSTAWLVLATFAVTAVASAGAAASVDISRCRPPGCLEDTTKLSLTGVIFGQAAVAVLAVLAVTNEHTTRMIQTTLAAIPRRVTVLLTKAGVVTTTVLAAGTLGVGGSLLAGHAILPHNGFTPTNGYAPLSLADEPTLRAAAGSVLYLVLIALLGLGIGTILRDTAGAIITILSLLYVVPIAAELLSDPQWSERLHRIGPTTAGLAVQATTELGHLPIGPWAGLGVLAAYAATAMLLGGWLFLVRDP